MFVCDGFNLDLNMKLKTDNQNFNKKIIMKKLVLVVAMFMFACGSFFTMAQDPVKKDPKKEVKDTAKTEPKKEVADTTAITVAASGAFAQFVIIRFVASWQRWDVPSKVI